MRQIKYALAGLLSLLSVTAAVAQAPATMPYHTVYGRLGAAPGDTGPGQALPFSILLTQIGGITSSRAINTTSPLAGGGNLTADRTLSIIANGISNSLIRQSGALSLVGNATNATANVGDISAVAGSSCAFIESSSTIICGQLATAAITNNAVTFAKFQQIAALSMFGNCTSSTANGAAVTGIANQVLRVTGAGTSCGFGAIDLSQAAAVASSILALANGGCNAALTASNGGILWSNASQCQILAGTATARLPLLSGATATPVWGAYTLPASVTSGGIPFFSSTTAEGSSALLVANQIMLGGGAGTAPATLGSLGTTTTVLHGNAGGAPAFSAIVSADMNITATNCTNQFVSAISTGGVGTCSTVTLASAQFANQGTTTTLLHGNAAGNPAFGQVVYADVASAAIASSAQYLAGTASELVQSGTIYQAETTTTFGATTTFDFSTFINTAVTLTGNITTQTLSNVTAGKAGTITFIQDGTGSRTSVWNSIFKFSGGTAPTLSTAASAIDVLSYSCRSATICVASLIKDVR